VLHDSHDEDHIHLKPLEFPKPMQGLAVETRKKGDEQRLFDILHKLELEDPCFEVERHPTTHETVIRGLGEMHLRYKLEKMATQFKLELDTRLPLIPYRETITAKAEGHCRHKKQSGGAGQFGEVYLKIEPLERGAGFEFVDHVKGGVIPGVFMTSVEKGVRQALERRRDRPAFRSEDLRVIVYDGKTHAVDGKEVAFVTAGRKAVRSRPSAPPIPSCWSPSSRSRSSRPKPPSATLPATCPAGAARSPAPVRVRAARRRSPAKCRWPRSPTTPRA
jgi:elongation factor G